MILTNRDQDLLMKLQSYGLLTTRQICDLVFGGITLTTVLRRLRKLEIDGYIKRATRLDGGEVLWALTNEGGAKVGAQVIKSQFHSNMLDHDLRLVRLRMKLEGLGIAKSWMPEHEIRSSSAKKWGLKWMKQKIIADGVMGVTHDRLQESVSIELELNWKNAGRYQKICEQYRQKDRLWGVWYVVANRGLGKAIQRVWKDTPNWNADFNFLWSLEDEVLRLGAKARVSWKNKVHELGEIFECKLPTMQALPSALRVSGLQGQDTLVRLNTTVENDEEKLAPAS